MIKSFTLILLIININILFTQSEEKPIYITEEKEYPKEYYDALVQKGLKKDNLTLGHPRYPYYEKIDYKKDKQRRKQIKDSFKNKENLRKLTEEQTLENLGFMSFIQNNVYSDQTKVMKFIVNNVQKDDSRFILYPYSFNYTKKNNESELENLKEVDGGVFSLNQALLKDQTFQKIENISSVKISKAKGIYDIDIAILSLVYEIKGMEVDLFTDANLYCNYFTNSISKTSNCLEGKNNYLEYKQKNPTKGAVVRISQVDLVNKTLYDPDTKQLKFKLLIISDYLTDNEQTIFSSKYLTNEAIKVIKEFQELGGHIIISGKSGYLLEKIGLIPEGTYDKNFILETTKDKGENMISGCQNIYKKTPEEQPDFFKQLICLGFKTRTVLSQTYKVQKVPDNFETLIEYTNTEKTLRYKLDGYLHDIDNRSETYPYILVSKEVEGKGRIFIVNGSPINNAYYCENVRNMILYAMSRNVIYDLKIKFNSLNNDNSEEDLPIPAGEEGVQLLTIFKFYNLYDMPISNFKLEILLANKLEFISAPSECTLKEEATKFKEKNFTDFNISKYLVCEAASLDKLSSIGSEFKVEITDFTMTQLLNDIPLLYSSISFKMKDELIEMTPGYFYAQAAIAALLRGTINKDPTSAYPMLGKGLYFDLPLVVENKENTVAKDVNFIAMIPLICPLVDGEDEGLIAKVVPVYEEYYFSHNFTYPWVTIEPKEDDYIDYAEVAGKNIVYVDDFDTPVKRSKRQRSDPDVIYKNKFQPLDVVHFDENMGASKGVTQNTLLREIYFGDSERFYETAAPRTSLFVNTALEEGAKAYYQNNTIPDIEKDVANEIIAKNHLAFIRVDTYFYHSIFNQYQLPKGLNSSDFISLDKFVQNNAPIEDKLFGSIPSKIQNTGHYDSSKGRFNTLKPNEWRNPLRQYKNMKRYDPTNTTELQELIEKSNGTIKLTHFMVPNKDPLITRAGNVYGFVENPDTHEGYLEEYNSLKFVYGHSIELILAPEITRLGGICEIILPSGVSFNDIDPVAEDRITTSADNVAVFKNEYDNTKRTVKVYFRRGLMPNENYGLPSKCKLFLENLNLKGDFDITLRILELKYDFSSPDLESYYLRETKTVKAKYISFFSFPCLYMENKLTRKSSFAEEYSNEMFEYELVNPYARYGGYFQELTKHTTVYGSAEAHHRKDPGFQGISAGFSIISNIGTSSIPFAEFLQHGTLAIPGVSSTSRLEWNDIWGRKWAQNLRSVYPDIPPIPPAPLNYIMTTTFELITNDNKQERVIEWQSDESVYIRVQMKMRNTYKLYWEPTICFANQRPIMKEHNTDYGALIFIDDRKTENNSIGSEWDINLAFSAVYGVCYDDNSYMNGTRINTTIKARIDEMMACSDTYDMEKMTNCSLKSKQDGLPIIKRRPDSINDTYDPTPNKNWNFSPLIKNYLPDGYINTNQMWQLTIEDYSDDEFYKGYPWHLDDCIPNLDNSITKPHDIIAFPIYKGIGYNITYSRDYSLKKFPEYKGWWSDQLQNKDHSLIAGQQRVSQVSVGHESLLQDSDWISAFDLKQREGKEYVIKDRLKNFYICKYNRHRVKVTPGQTKYSYLKNVYQNNVVPILPDLQEDDPRYSNYQCKEDEPQFSIYNISQEDNRVYTGNDRDWLYFAAGLRANAIEDINVIMKMDPLEGSKFEGITKVQDGGRFTYWQPPDGPNSYQYYDGNVNTVISKRVDITISAKLIPTSINTFNTYLYELFDINDEKELNREYTLNTYMNSHGYGDATTTVYVGGVDATSCRVEPGNFTYVKIVFYNNAGFDWKMKPNAIELNETAYNVFLNANNINRNKISAIQYPLEYRFMSYNIPEEIKPYITLTPSQHVMDISPQFFDLTFNNILTIKDALEGDYFYCLNVSENFPEDLKGKLWEINMTLNEEYFDTLPSKNDPTNEFKKVHDYNLTIPSIRFGVPIGVGENRGKIFYNLGQARDFVFNFRLYNEFEIKGIKLIDEEILNRLGIAAEDTIDKFTKLKEVWDSIPDNQNIINKINYTSILYEKNTFYNNYTMNLTKAFPLFPYEEAANKPYKNRIYLLVQSYSPHSPYGYKNLITNTRLTYNDSRKLKYSNSDPNYVTVYSSGPHFAPSLEHKIVEYNETTHQYDVVKNQNIYNGDNIIIKLTFTAKNEGTKEAYNPKFNITVDANAEYISTSQTTSAIRIEENEIVDGKKLINIYYTGLINANDQIKFDFYFKIKFIENQEESNTNLSRRRRNLASNNEYNLVKNIQMSLCLANVECVEGDINYGKQKSDLIYVIKFNNLERIAGKVSLKAENIGTELMPQYKLEAIIDSQYTLKNVEYVFLRKINGKDDDFVEIKRTTSSIIIDQPYTDEELKDNQNYTISYKVNAELKDDRILDNKLNNLYQHTFLYKLGKITLNAENIGNDTIPKYKLEAVVDTNYDKTNMEFIFFRKIEGKDDDFVEIKRSKESIYIDQPFTEDEIKELKNYTVIYKVIADFGNGKKLDSSNDNINLFEDSYKIVEQEDKEEEKEKENKKNLPLYAIILILILGLVVLSGIAFITYKLLTKKVVETAAMVASQNPGISVKNYAGDFEKVASSSSGGKKRSIKNRPKINNSTMNKYNKVIINIIF